MGLTRTILCIILPPLAVLDKGCGSFILVLILTISGWLPGVIAALIICSADKVYTELNKKNIAAKDDIIDVEAKEL